ncbi:MAG: hypothetical protein V4438_00530 [Patescibacteria group bacterium]
MPDQFGDNEEIKKQYLAKALNANKEAADGAKFTDLFDKGSTIYERPEKDAEDAEKLKRQSEREKAVPAKPTTDSEGFPIIDPVHTYREDLAGIVNKDKISLERIAMMQNVAREEKPKPEEPIKKQNRTFIIAGSALVALSLLLIFSVFIFRRNAAAPVAEAPKEKYIIASESNQQIDISNITKTEMQAEVKRDAASFKEQDNVEEIIPMLGGARAPLSELLFKTNASVPDDLARTLSQRFFLGLYSKAGKTDPFLILYTSSYDIAYPAMLRYEGSVETDLNWLFEQPAKIGTTTPILSFKDKVIANTDVRSYETDAGKAMFFYVFLDQNTILFARNVDTVRMVQSRLREAKFQ